MTAKPLKRASRSERTTLAHACWIFRNHYFDQRTLSRLTDQQRVQTVNPVDRGTSFGQEKMVAVLGVVVFEK